MARDDISRWVDYAREILPERENRALRARLAEDDAQQERRLVATLRRLVRTAESEARHEPPAYAVRSVEAHFRMQRPRAEVRRRVPLPLSLTLDSAFAPAAAGARSLHDTTRQLLFQSGEFAMDVRIDYPSDNRQAIVVGQVLSRSGKPLRRAAAYLMNAGEVASSALTSDFGSFYIEGGRELPLELRLIVDEDHEISVDLDPSQLSS